MSITNKLAGLLDIGTIQSVDASNGEVDVSLDLQQNANSTPLVTCKFAPSMLGVNGLFAGQYPSPGARVVVGMGTNNTYYIVGHLANPDEFPYGYEEDMILQQTDDENRFVIKKSNGISLGGIRKFFKVDNGRGIIGHNLPEIINTTDAFLEYSGTVKRDFYPNNKFHTNEYRREDFEFSDSTVTIGLDPSYPTNSSNLSGTIRNPGFAEKREIVYEFSHVFDFTNDAEEAKAYQTNGKPKTPDVVYNRREARTDTLSLSLTAPNYLMETVKGTVVDIYGNVLDLNRSILPAGKEKEYSFNSSQDKVEVFKKLREAERKSIAYHFEINARKASNSGIFTAPSVTDTTDFARQRSRFFFDIDKEGQFKLNVPASSDSGNIPFLVRYENGSTIEAEENGTDPNQFSFDNKPKENADTRKDIFLDSFAYNGGSIEVDDEENKSGYSVPSDRITTDKLKHGTVYHEIKDTLKSFQSYNYVSYEYEKNTVITDIPVIESVVSPKITLSGKNANAGGRSGSINFDGSIDLNIGANTIDRQSMWLDCQGSIIGNLGRDRNGVSMGITMTGDLLVEVGGLESTNDSRFNKYNNAWRPGAVEFRVYRDNENLKEMTVFRIDNNGLTLMTPGNIVISAGQQMMLKAMHIGFEADSIEFFSNDPDAKRFMQRTGQSL